MADLAPPAFYRPPSETSAAFIDCELTKLAPEPGQVLLLQTPPEASLDQVMHVLSHINQIAPEGVHVACIDSNFNLMVTNVPEVVAMLQKPFVTH